jgi:hypothetical protein
MTTITKHHRFTIAQAWEGDGTLSIFIQRWVDGEPCKHPTVEGTIEALERVAQVLAEAEADLLRHQDLVEALQWLPMGAGLDFYDLDDLLEELRGEPSRWLPTRECPHTGDYPRCIKCRNGDD